MTGNPKYKIDLNLCHKVIIGEGRSDSHFFEYFCKGNGIAGFCYAYTGMHNPETFSPAGFTEFVRYLTVLYRLSGFDSLTDVVLVCDSADNQETKMNELRVQIRNANRSIGKIVYVEPADQNVIQTSGVPRVHVLMIPKGRNGGLESICVDVARDHQNINSEKGTRIESWVNTFADSACLHWSTEKRDKLRLQAFLSATYAGKPDLHFSQLFEITKNNLVPLNGEAFNDVREFLKAVEAL